jgi:energy-coupling factor transport system ATP-binding protein
VRIALEDVRHVYAPGTPFEVEALRGVSLSVEGGEVLCIVGGTGSGKSTLAQHLNLLLEPTGGRVLADGRDAREMRRAELRRRVGLVFQFPEAALFAPTVLEDVAFAPRRMGLSEGEVRERVSGALEMLGISHLSGRAPVTLSGGEARRAAIAGILAMGPEVLVLDEPTAGLDPATRDGLIRLVGRLRDAGTTVVLVSHDLDEVAEVADRVCVLERGLVKATGTPAEVFYGELAEAQVGDPEGALAPATVKTVAALRGAFPGLGWPVRFEETLATLKALVTEGRAG